MTTSADGSPDQNEESQAAIGLSFSGGGFRATAFSLGTLALLHDLGLMSRARVMSGVSGGSLAVGAYLCSKAGSGADSEVQFKPIFYGHFYRKLLRYLKTQHLAEAFVSLPKLLAGKKLLHSAADSVQEFLETLLDEPPLLSSQAISSMLNKAKLAPDYVFFNTANITTLDLFRFGLQRNMSAPEDQPIYVLSRYFLRPRGDDTSSQIHRHAGLIRLSDCIASSFAFPVGFEPMIFPHDFFRANNRPPGLPWRSQPWEEARAAFEMTPICDHKPYIAFLDGGLYDNLGLASVEDIRVLEERSHKNQAEERSHRMQQQVAEPADGTEQRRIRYVIATDVDNIQPSNSAYSDPDLERTLQTNGDRGRQAEERSRTVGVARGLAAGWLRQSWQQWLRWIVVGVLVLIAIIQRSAWLPALSRALPSLAASILIVVISVAATGALMVRLGVRLAQGLRRRDLPGTQQAQPEPSLAERLGLGERLQSPSLEVDPKASLISLLLRMVRSGKPETALVALRSALVSRRIMQLPPAFSGYLKRTRSLTYGYLQKSYASTRQESQADGMAQDCYLIRNMIFELTPGPDFDPEKDEALITLPVRDYAKRDEQSDRTLNWCISQKLRLATELAETLQDHRDRSPQQQLMRTKLHQTADGICMHADLNLTNAAKLWLWLNTRLGFDAEAVQQCPGPREEVKPDQPHREIQQLINRVHSGLHVAIARVSSAQPGLEQRLRERCRVDMGLETSVYSWIPLISEMATNLATTLWVSSYRWYVFNGQNEAGAIEPGGWYAHEPSSRDIEGRLWLDAGPNQNLACEITVLAGYISMAFNLLEFAYSTANSKT